MEINNKKDFRISNICCIGAGYVGGPTMAVLANFCPNIKINVVDLNLERINKWNGELTQLPVFEPGLEEIIKSVRNKNLFFSTNVRESIENADMIFISVNTPIKTKGIGAGQASDLSWVESSAREISKYARGHTIVVEKSTLPVKTAEIIKSILYSTENSESVINDKKTFSVISNPEFLAEGSAIENLKYPDRVLIGGEDEFSVEALKRIYLNWVKKEKIITTNLWSSELSKLIANAFLAQRISSINSVSMLCEATGANINEVAKAIGTDSRIGEKFLESGPGFGGSCFKKDILNLVYICRSFFLNEVADYWEGVLSINDWQQNRVYKTIVKKLYGNLNAKKLLILGYSFKANTNDTRNSPAIEICKNLLKEGAYLVINDPKVTEEEVYKSLSNKNELSNKNVFFEKDILKAANKADAIILLTNWQEYENLDWDQIYQKMRKPAWVFDTRNILSSQTIHEIKLNVWQLGNGSNNLNNNNL